MKSAGGREPGPGAPRGDAPSGAPGEAPGEAPSREAPGALEPGGDLPPRRRGESITDYRAAAFLMVLFLLALGMMYLTGRGR